MADDRVYPCHINSDNVKAEGATEVWIFYEKILGGFDKVVEFARSDGFFGSTISITQAGFDFDKN